MSKRQELTTGKEYLVLITCASSARLSIKALQTLAAKKAFSYAIAKAYVISTPIQKLSALLFGLITVFKKRPVKFFTDKEKATIWLEMWLCINLGQENLTAAGPGTTLAAVSRFLDIRGAFNVTGSTRFLHFQCL